MSQHPSFRDEPWYDDELDDYRHARSDDERRLMLLAFGFDEAHRRDAERLFNPPVPVVEPPTQLDRMESELKKQTKQIEQIRQDAAQKMSDYEAKHDEEKRSEQLHSLEDKKQSFRHDFKVAIFSAAIVYILDHLQDIFDLIHKIFCFLA